MRFLTNDKKVGEIELFRFVFSIVILLMHSHHLFDKYIFFVGGGYAVEFFFIVSGFLMMSSIEKLQNNPINNLGKETTSFIFKKVKAFYPEVVVSFIIGFAIQIIAKSLTKSKILALISKTFFEVTLLQSAGLGANSVNSPIWYIQSMLLAMALLYPLIRKYPKIMKHIIMPLTVLLLLGFLQQNYTHLRHPGKWIGFTYKGNIRAIAELCLGAECYFVVQWLKNFKLKWFTKTFLTLVKWGCWIAVIQYMIYCKKGFEMDFFFLAIFCIAIILAFSQQCIDSRIYQNILVDFLGKLSLPLYLSHMYFSIYLNSFLPNGLGLKEKLLIYVTCITITSLIVIALAKIIRKTTPKFINSFKNLILQK